MSDNLDVFEFSHIHKIVLGILHLDLEAELQKPAYRGLINSTDSAGQTTLF